MQTANRKRQAGFTLLEMGIVIAITGILAAVAIPKFADTTAQSELTTIKNFKAALITAAGMYKSTQNVEPNSFALFASNLPGGGLGTGKYTITTFGVGPNGNTSPCTPQGATITCSGTFKKYSSVVYRIDNFGNISGNATAGAGNTLGNASF